MPGSLRNAHIHTPYSEMASGRFRLQLHRKPISEPAPLTDSSPQSAAVFDSDSRGSR